MNLAQVNPARTGTKSAGLSNAYVSTCKVCGFGVYETQDRQWARRPTGISHTDCLRRYLLAATAEAALIS